MPRTTKSKELKAYTFHDFETLLKGVIDTKSQKKYHITVISRVPKITDMFQVYALADKSIFLRTAATLEEEKLLPKEKIESLQNILNTYDEKEAWQDRGLIACTLLLPGQELWAYSLYVPDYKDHPPCVLLVEDEQGKLITSIHIKTKRMATPDEVTLTLHAAHLKEQNTLAEVFEINTTAPLNVDIDGTATHVYSSDGLIKLKAAKYFVNETPFMPQPIPLTLNQLHHVIVVWPKEGKAKFSLQFVHSAYNLVVDAKNKTIKNVSEVVHKNDHYEYMQQPIIVTDPNINYKIQGACRIFEKQYLTEYNPFGVDILKEVKGNMVEFSRHYSHPSMFGPNDILTIHYKFPVCSEKEKKQNFELPQKPFLKSKLTPGKATTADKKYAPLSLGAMKKGTLSGK